MQIVYIYNYQDIAIRVLCSYLYIVHTFAKHLLQSGCLQCLHTVTVRLTFITLTIPSRLRSRIQQLLLLHNKLSKL